MKSQQKWTKLKQIAPEAGLNDFLRYHRKNPQVYQTFKRLAERMCAAGWKRYSANAIMHAVRWEHDLGSPNSEFKVNNNYTPLYARALAIYHPEFKDFFETRSSRKLKAAA